jgi:hypothetical protein
MRGQSTTILLLCLASACAPALGQSTDGHHAIQVLPVVVDTASFTQRITVRSADPIMGAQVSADYYPADGTTQATPVKCYDLSFAGSFTFDGLRELCPGIAPGSQFGTLVMRSGTTQPFALHSRVSNAAGAGFSVEGFPAHTFTPAVSAVTGLRRRAATGGAPAFQSNCFVGNLADLTPAPIPASTTVNVELWDDDVLLGSTAMSLPPGRLVRLLDVFAAVGDLQGDRDDITAVFRPDPGTTPALLAFCTVQDNTSFGADFRIAKPELGPGMTLGQPDELANRSSRVGGDFRFTGTATTRGFSIPKGNSRNVHAVYFRHPDVIGCSIWNGIVNAGATPGYGLEFRLLARIDGGDDWEVVAGGDEIVSFNSVYLGDKTDRGGGRNTRYMLEVESNGQNTGVERPYLLDCRSGSGHTLGELVLSGAQVAF